MEERDARNLRDGFFVDPETVADIGDPTSSGLWFLSKLAKPTSARRIQIPLQSLISFLSDTQKCLERAEYQRYQ
jgi:hypothetical protein